jgi:antitoxin component of MazEF toxin-antitoxin module
MNTNDIDIPVQPGKENGPDLNELLAAVTDENLHPEVDTGEPVGKEVVYP